MTSHPDIFWGPHASVWFYFGEGKQSEIHCDRHSFGGGNGHRDTVRYSSGLMGQGHREKGSLAQTKQVQVSEGC